MRREKSSRRSPRGMPRDERGPRAPRLRGGRLELAVCLALAAVAFALYARTGGHPFTNYDDFDYVVENPHLAQGLGWSNVRWAFSTLEREFWHPLTWLSYLADVSLFGLRPGPMHLANAVLHAATSALLFLALARLTGAPARSACAAALFAVHPMHVESVAWISERKDVLSVFFGVLALLAYAGYVRRPTLARFAPVAAAFAASLLAKSTLVTLPALLLLLDAWPLGRLPLRGPGELDPPGGVPKVGWARALLEKLPLLALSIASACVTLVAQARGGLVLSSAGSYRPGDALVSYVRYVAKLLWPADLAVVYPLEPFGEPIGKVLAAGAAIAVLTGAAIAGRRRAPWFTVGWLWFAGTLLPVSGIVQVGAQSMADRYTYFPSIGLFVAAVWGAARLLHGTPPARAAPAAALCVLALLAIRTDRQVRLWSDDELLFRHAISATGPNVRAQEMLANVLRNRGKDEEAYEHLLEAVRILPNPQSLTALGAVLGKLGHDAHAEKAYAFALSMDPRREEAALALAELLVAQGRQAEAADVLARAAAAAPPPHASSVPRRLALAAALAGLGRIPQACESWRSVAASPQATREDRERAAREANAAGCDGPR